MAPPRARDLAIELIANFDDEALRTFLDPADGGVEPADLGAAVTGCDTRLISRVRDSLPAPVLPQFDDAHTAAKDPGSIERSRRRVINRLFWPLVYWNDPDDYEELVAGEQIHPRVLDALDLDDRVVCDIGAGGGRFTLLAALRARRVIAVDAVPALLQRLERKAGEAGLHNIEIRRGSFTALPVEDAAVDVAVFCSSLTSSAPHGGRRALAEAERIVRPGGEVAVIWPQQPAWFRRRGFAYLAVRGNDVLHFRDTSTAIRLCRSYYSEAAARWVQRNQRADVPFRVLRVSPPNDVCVKRVTPSRSPDTRDTRRTSGASAPRGPG